MQQSCAQHDTGREAGGHLEARGASQACRSWPATSPRPHAAARCERAALVQPTLQQEVEPLQDGGVLRRPLLRRRGRWERRLGLRLHHCTAAAIRGSAPSRQLRPAIRALVGCCYKRGGGAATREPEGRRNGNFTIIGWCEAIAVACKPFEDCWWLRHRWRRRQGLHLHEAAISTLTDLREPHRARHASGMGQGLARAATLGRPSSGSELAGPSRSLHHRRRWRSAL